MYNFYCPISFAIAGGAA